MHVYVCVCDGQMDVRPGQPETSDSPELKLESYEALSCLRWMLVTELCLWKQNSLLTANSLSVPQAWKLKPMSYAYSAQKKGELETESEPPMLPVLKELFKHSYQVIDF